MKKISLQPKFASFALATTAFASGALLFFFWPNSAHQNTRFNPMDDALLNTAFSMQEILSTNFAATLPSGTATNLETDSRKQQSLTQLVSGREMRIIYIQSKNKTKRNAII